MHRDACAFGFATPQSAGRPILGRTRLRTHPCFLSPIRLSSPEVLRYQPPASEYEMNCSTSRESLHRPTDTTLFPAATALLRRSSFPSTHAYDPTYSVLQSGPQSKSCTTSRTAQIYARRPNVSQTCALPCRFWHCACASRQPCSAMPYPFPLAANEGFGRHGWVQCGLSHTAVWLRVTSSLRSAPSPDT